MSEQITALRGPIVNSTRDPRIPESNDSLVYISDAVIILKGNKIVEFGPAHVLKYKLVNIKIIKISRVCRIIKSVICH